jgi:hypothetical protein
VVLVGNELTSLQQTLLLFPHQVFLICYCSAVVVAVAALGETLKAVVVVVLAFF